MANIPLFTRFYTSQVVQDFVHQQYHGIKGASALFILGRRNFCRCQIAIFPNQWSLPCGVVYRWWQLKYLFIFTPTWGRFPMWRAYFSDGLVQPPSSFTLTLRTWQYCNRDHPQHRIRIVWNSHFLSEEMSEFHQKRSQMRPWGGWNYLQELTFKSKEANSVNWGGSKLGCPFEALKFNTLITREKNIDTVERNPNKKWITIPLDPKTRWWFQIFFIFTPTWGKDPIWLIFFRWVETTN